MKKSLRKVWLEAKKEPVFSLLYIGGVAFAIAFIMIYAILYYVQAAPIYPEYNRGRTYKIYQMTMNSERMSSQSYISQKFVDEHLSRIEGYDEITAVNGSDAYVQPLTDSPEFSAKIQKVTPGFFKIFSYEFLQGKPFTEEQMTSEQKIAIITDRTAMQAFGTTDNAIGKEISINMEPYLVAGVVRQSSPIAKDSFGQIFMPNPRTAGYEAGGIRDYMGGSMVFFTLKPGYSADDLQKQIDDITKRLLAAEKSQYSIEDGDSHSGITEFYIQPMESVVQTALSNFSHTHTWADVIKQHALMLVVLLIIPALNISGMIGAHMERIYSEIGIRRSFGATKSAILRQVMLENLYLTIAGGIVGLICAWTFIWFAQGWIFDLVGGNRFTQVLGVDKNLSSDMLFAPAIFLIAFAICLILNLASAYIPVRWTLRKQVVNYINENK